MDSSKVTPLVSIFCMVYNHEPFLKECLDGFLMQKCDFDFEIVVGEDFSNDNSRVILLEYANRNPEKFKLILHEKNVGAAENQRIVLENCTGKYIAMCEGDDFWTDPLKLQKQVDFLEANEEYSGSCHFVSVVKDNKVIKHSFKKLVYQERWEIEDLKKIDGTLISQTSSFVFKRKALNLDEITYFSSKIFHGDTLIFTSLWKYGPVHLMNENMSVYRLHEIGVTNILSNSNSKFYRDRVIESNVFIELFPFVAYKFQYSKYVNFILYILKLKLENANPKRASFLMKQIFCTTRTLNYIIQKKSFRRPVFRLLFQIIKKRILSHL